MTFDYIQDRIAEKLQKVNSEIETLETVFDSQNADARLRMLSENSHFLEMLAFFICNQDEEIATLKAQNNRLNIRVAALLSVAGRTTLRANAAMSVSSLIQSKFDRLNTQTESWLKHELGEDDYNFLTQKQAA